MSARGLAVVVAVAIGAGLGGGGASSSLERGVVVSRGVAPRADVHLRTQAAMRGCLRAHGAKLDAVPLTPTSLRYLHDLAQHRSFLASVGGSTAGVAVPPSVANAELLVELLTLPGSGYVATRENNVVFLAQRSGAKALRLAVSCARAGTP